MAAARALARSGFNAVSMSDIAEEVGFTAPAIYAYFDSKEAIFAELLRTLEPRAGRDLRAAARSGPDVSRAGRGAGAAAARVDRSAA